MPNAVPFGAGRSIPLNVLEDIAWHLVVPSSHILDALPNLLSLLLTSKTIYEALSPGHALSYANGQQFPLRTTLYARLCEVFLDIKASKRRWWGRLQRESGGDRGRGGGGGPTTSALTAHLINVTRTLSFFKRSMAILESPNQTSWENQQALAYTLYSPTVPLHLLTTFLFTLEHDCKNIPLLLSVGAHRFIHILMLKRLSEGREENDYGWPVENVLNTLSLWCFWMVSSGRETLENESTRTREWVVNLVLPFVVMPFRYASALAPPTHYTLPLPPQSDNSIFHSPGMMHTAHGPYPVYYTNPTSGKTLMELAAQDEAREWAETQARVQLGHQQVQAGQGWVQVGQGWVQAQAQQPQAQDEFEDEGENLMAPPPSPTPEHDHLQPAPVQEPPAIQGPNPGIVSEVPLRMPRSVRARQPQPQPAFVQGASQAQNAFVQEASQAQNAFVQEAQAAPPQPGFIQEAQADDETAVVVPELRGETYDARRVAQGRGPPLTTALGGPARGVDSFVEAGFGGEGGGGGGGFGGGDDGEGDDGEDSGEDDDDDDDDDDDGTAPGPPRFTQVQPQRVVQPVHQHAQQGQPLHAYEVAQQNAHMEMGQLPHQHIGPPHAQQPVPHHMHIHQPPPHAPVHAHVHQPAPHHAQAQQQPPLAHHHAQQQPFPPHHPQGAQHPHVHFGPNVHAQIQHHHQPHQHPAHAHVQQHLHPQPQVNHPHPQHPQHPHHPHFVQPHHHAHPRQPFQPPPIRPHPTPYNSHTHPSFGVHVFWYSSMGLCRAEDERVRSEEVRGGGILEVREDREEEEGRGGGFVQGDPYAGWGGQGMVGSSQGVPGMGAPSQGPSLYWQEREQGTQGVKRRRKHSGGSISHRELRKRSGLGDPTSPSARGIGGLLPSDPGRPLGETPPTSEGEDDSGDESDSEDYESESSEEEDSDEGESLAEIYHDDYSDEEEWQDFKRSLLEERERVRAERAQRREVRRLQREEEARRKAKEEKERVWMELKVHPRAREWEYDISAEGFCESVVMDPLGLIEAQVLHEGGIGGLVSEKGKGKEKEKEGDAKVDVSMYKEEGPTSTPTPYNVYAPLRLLLPPPTIPAKMIFLSRREMKPLDHPERFRRRGEPEAEQEGGQAGAEAEENEVNDNANADVDPVDAGAAPLQDQDVQPDQPIVQQAPPPPLPPAQPAPPPPLAQVPNAQPPRRGPRPTIRDLQEVANFRIAKVRGYPHFGDAPYESDEDDEDHPISVDYDTEWARMLVCWRILEYGAEEFGGIGAGRVRRGHRGAGAGEEARKVELPSILHRSNTLKWRLGRVYERGMLSGLWQGRMYFPTESSMGFIARRRTFPQNFGEMPLGIHVRPVFVRFEEHGFVKVPGLFDDVEDAKRRASSQAGDGKGRQNGDSWGMEKDRGKYNLDRRLLEDANGIVNTAIPVSEPRLRPENAPVMFLDENMNNAWLPGSVGSLIWEHDSSEARGVTGEWGDGSTRDVYVEHLKERDEARKKGKEKEGGSGMSTTMKMDSVTFLVPTPKSVTADRSSPVEDAAGSRAVEVKKYVYETYEDGRECLHERLEKAREEARFVKGMRVIDADDGEGKTETYFYTHPGCLKCREKERVAGFVQEYEEQRRMLEARLAKLKDEEAAARVIKEARRRAELEQEAEKMFASVGLGREAVEAGAEDDVEERERKEVVDISVGQGQPGTNNNEDDANDPLKDYNFAASHLPPCDDGIEDTLITGTMDERHENAWGRFVYYGRVRPWDGLVGFVRLQIHPDDVPDGEEAPAPASTHYTPQNAEGSGSRQHGPGRIERTRIGDKFFFFGYIHAGRTIVGNWRYVGVDPIIPTMESAFMISRRDD